MLVKNLISDEIPIPGEPNQWMRFRRLNSRRIAECSDKKQMDSMQRMKTLGKEGMELIRDAAAGRDKTAAAKADPIDTYDRDLLLKAGIHSWSYDADIKTELESEDDGLDAKTSEWAARQILEYNNLLPEVAEEASGN